MGSAALHGEIREAEPDHDELDEGEEGRRRGDTPGGFTGRSLCCVPDPCASARLLLVRPAPVKETTRQDASLPHLAVAKYGAKYIGPGSFFFLN